MAKLAEPLLTDAFLFSTCILLPKDQLPGDRACIFCVSPILSPLASSWACQVPSHAC